MNAARHGFFLSAFIREIRGSKIFAGLTLFRWICRAAAGTHQDDNERRHLVCLQVSHLRDGISVEMYCNTAVSVPRLEREFQDPVARFSDDAVLTERVIALSQTACQAPGTACRTPCPRVPTMSNRKLDCRAAGSRAGRSP
ncbi:MAG: hypothetical protein ONB48_03000 [candidate division KSB1 bacterium]|nr:hypothetical protein [candidate division KSB1 bacterium]MDZ7275695.1 hypothetical protein [candidate division KSB1 bacterium]MDZ7284614.1 hypothetical protein [candidate division KSB1 bacterium]MDZ7297967.1 hypothetical protein [candidate division KSB1 bacterium]MDZ7305865.1 hypothetical protein [candidate division KSB1 bacterium]